MDQEEGLSFFPYTPDYSCSDIDSSFTSSTTSSAASTFSAHSSLSLPSFNNTNAVTGTGATLLPHPHSRCSDPRWSALRAAADLSPDGLLHLRHLRLLRPLGSGHLARVFHCRLQGFEADDDDGSTSADFALKVIDLNMLSRSSSFSRLDRGNGNDDDDEGDGKMWHVRAEARALAALDHPFLPTLYARLDASHYACFLIDYCPGGDLHGLLRRVRGHRLPPAAARFYASEVLLALEYLHALGFIYRDLKPENVLLRTDGHVMLSDFDLSFRSSVSPTLLRHHRRRRHDRRRSHCLGGGPSRSEEDEDSELEFVAEPQGAYSKACVGTHEYLAPEVVSNVGHGSAVDWWAFGVFLYELLYGRTPFKGATKEATLRNILTQDVQFPEMTGRNAAEDAELAKARDLISRLLTRDPRRRMGAARGAVEIKRHPFFESVRWPLVRRVRPPFVPGGHAAASTTPRAAPPRRGASKEKKARGRWWWSSWRSANSKNNNNILISRSSSFISRGGVINKDGHDDIDKKKKGVKMGFGMFKMGINYYNYKNNNRKVNNSSSKENN